MTAVELSITFKKGWPGFGAALGAACAPRVDARERMLIRSSDRRDGMVAAEEEREKGERLLRWISGRACLVDIIIARYMDYLYVYRLGQSLLDDVDVDICFAAPRAISPRKRAQAKTEEYGSTTRTPLRDVRAAWLGMATSRM